LLHARRQFPAKRPFTQNFLHPPGDDFYQYTLQHFFHEEILMNEVQYPFIGSNIQEHEGLVNTLKKILDVGKKELAKDELEDFVGFWLVKHITTFDTQFTVYVRRNCVVTAT
jgi:hemerythrin-like metal-binding protein